MITMSRVARFLEHHKYLWVPLLVAIVALWIFAGIMAPLARNNKAIADETLEVEFNSLTVIFDLCFVSFIELAITIIKVGCEEGDKLCAPDLTLTTIGTVLLLPILSTLVCGAGLLPWIIIIHYMGYSDYLHNFCRMMMVKPGPTFMAAGMILISYLALGILLEIVFLTFKYMNKKRKREN